MSLLEEPQREEELAEGTLTHNLDSVDEIPVDVIAYLTDVIARIVRLYAGYYEVIPVQTVARIPAHDDVGRCQHVRSASPQNNEVSCS